MPAGQPHPASGKRDLAKKFHQAGLLSAEGTPMSRPHDPFSSGKIKAQSGLANSIGY